MYRDVPVVRVSQQKNILTHLAQAAELLLLLNAILGSWLMSGNNGKCGMFRCILRSRFHFPCNNFMNQKGKCVMLSVHLELYIFRALCKHFFCTSDFMMGGDGKFCQYSEYNSCPPFILCCGSTVVRWSLLLQELLWAFQSLLELCSLWVGC